MAFWDNYWKSLKPLDVEEPVDVWVHRPLAYVLAKALFSTPVSPNVVTVGSILLGLAASLSMVCGFPDHLQAAGLGLFLSAVLDCADGQLARMRGTSSVFGRMLDGSADLIVSCAAVVGATYLVWLPLHQPPWLGWLTLALCVVTIVTGSFHTSTYDHYKNLFLRITHPVYREGEDYEDALARYRSTSEQRSAAVRLTWPVYLFYVKSQLDYVRGFDPYTKVSTRGFPAFDEKSAAIYRAHCGRLMRLWRTWFGFGSLVFGMSVSIALGVVQYYMLYRLVFLNALFYGYVRPRQRAASRAAFSELAALAPGFGDPRAFEHAADDDGLGSPRAAGR